MNFGGPVGNFPSANPSHKFSQVPVADIQRSTFDRSHNYKTTFNSGYLIPVFCDEALPGDTFSVNMTAFCRLATPITPVMDNLYCDSFFFAIPYRLVWNNWEKFNGAQDNPGDSTSFLIPTATSPTGGYTVQTLQDYFGLPTAGQVGGGNTVTHSNLPLRAYNLTWNEWFRDQNLQNSVTVDKGDGPDTYSNYSLLRRGRRHDYFTSCLPWPQKGTAVSIPLGTVAPISGLGGVVTGATTGPQAVHEYRSASTVNYPFYQQAQHSADSNNNFIIRMFDSSGSGGPFYPDVYADLSKATAATINSLRQAFQIQRLYERDARGGTRYTEIIKSHFGVTSPDARLQRPEYLGGGSTPITFTPIPQTAATGASGTTTPQGNLAGIATMLKTNNGFTKSFTEHCIVLGLISIRADQNYQQGMNRMWSRSTRFDFYWPALSHLGEQAVLNQEIYCDGSGPSGNDGGVFGYQERYAEYRYKPSQITGQFRSTYSTPLDIWHLAVHYSVLPTLNSTFIQDTPPVQRVVAVENPYPEFLGDFYFRFKAARPMPTYSVPGLIDHF